MKKKNLVFIHLESISNTILWQYRVELSTVWRLMRQSLYFSRFNTGSTSTSMSTADILWGTSVLNDHMPVYDVTTPPPWNPTMVFNYLSEMGYNYAHYGLDLFLRQRYDYVYRHVYPEISMLLADMKTEMATCVAQNTPFAMLFNNGISHMAFDDEHTIQAKSFSDRFRLSYLRMDEAINNILGTLIELGIWENTVIVCFGDHGDELWSHGLNKGYCHAIAPYASLTWTPLFIYDNGNRAGEISDRLFSAVDIRETIIKMLYPGFQSEKFRPFDDLPFSGIDAVGNKRDFAFSQNMYALQLEYSDPEKGMVKGYSVTDGTYRLVVSSGGNRIKNGGMEFYCDPLDPTNSRNLLDFFKLDFNGDIIGFYPPPEAVSAEFNLAFNPEAVKHLGETFQTLKRELHSYVREKEKTAMPHNKGQYHTMPEAAFKQAKKRLYKDFF